MGAQSATATLRLPLRLHGIQLGRPVDLLLDATDWRVLGLVVLCGDTSTRFVAWPAVSVRPDEIAVGSALMLLEDVDFYRSRGRSLRSLLGAPAGADDEPLRDLMVLRDGAVTELVVGVEGDERRVATDRQALAGSGEAV